MQVTFTLESINTTSVADTLSHSILCYVLSFKISNEDGSPLIIQGECKEDCTEGSIVKRKYGIQLTYDKVMNTA